MNNVTPEKKQGLLNTLAIIGLVGIIIFIAWIAIQLVSLFPSAVTSLASLADSVYNSNPTKEITVEKKIVINSSDKRTSVGKNTLISWENDATSGQFSFKYKCEDGLSLSIETASNKFSSTDCNNTYNLGLVDTAVLIIESEKKAVADLTYTISYFKENSLTESSSVTKTIEVENPRFTEETATSTTATSTVTKPTTKPAAPIYEYIYTVPVSNPNGFTDLVIAYIGIGKQNSAGVFTNTGFLSRNETGAFQFSVKNVGTKTSDEWTFEAELPGGIDYKSDKQKALKPNERTTITIGFSSPLERGTEKFGVEVDVDNDTNKRNNNFTWTAEVK